MLDCEAEGCWWTWVCTEILDACGFVLALPYSTLLLSADKVQDAKIRKL